MAEASPTPPLPAVRLEVRQGLARPAAFALTETDYLIGTVPGCDLRVSGGGLPAVLCLLSRGPGHVNLRKLAATVPLTVNGKAVAKARLVQGDEVRMGAVELVVHVEAPAGRGDPTPVEPPTVAQAGSWAAPAAEDSRRQQLEEMAARLDARRQEIEEQAAELEANRVYWYERREEVERECRKQLETVEALRNSQAELQAAAVPVDLRRREQTVAETEKQLRARAAELDGRDQDLERQRQELATLRQELADIRRQLYERYQERRDRLAGIQEAVNRAAQKIQERKRRFDADAQQARLQRQQDEARRAHLDAQAAELERARQQFEHEQELDARRRRQQQEELAARATELAAQEQQLAAGHAALEQSRQQHRDDLVRLDRLKADLEKRDQELQARAADVERRLEQMQQDTRELEQQVTQLDDWQTRLTARAEQLDQRKAEQDAAAAQLAQRAATLEGQQAMLAGLRTRLERMREEVRAEEQQQAAERTRLEALDQEVQQRLAEAKQLAGELEADQALREQERRQLAERSAVLDRAVAQLRQAQEKSVQDEQRLRSQAVELEAREAEHREALSLMQARMQQCEDLQQRLEAERQALRERATLLTQAEQAREALQEQLRRRSEELAARQKAVAEQVRQCEAATAAVQARHADLDDRAQQLEGQSAALHREIEERAQALASLQDGLAQREQTLRATFTRIKETGRAVAGERKALHEERARLTAERQEVERATAAARAEFERAKREAVVLQQSLPDLELRAGTAFERLSFAREQLREHLQEVHAYASQCQDDLETLRGQVQGEADRLQQREQMLRRGQDEHRLAVASFRQQLLAWQGQLADMKRLLAQGETRLERRHAQVVEQVRHVGAESERLARQAHQLQQRERLVEEQKAEVGRHLAEMRDWYRQKLRELAGVDEPGGAAKSSPLPADKPELPESQGDEDVPLIPVRRDILSLTDEVDPADTQLGEQLRTLGLVDAETLTALLVEARRQRRSLRQVLLASGAVTRYQMTLMEAGDLDGLILGPVRIVDRLQENDRETLYRVFDPRSGQEAVLRHLAPAQMEDAVRPDEYRQRFMQAMHIDPNVAAPLEVLDVAGRPAVLQEQVFGLASPDWPAHLVAAPGVWLRLAKQAASALRAAHEAGLAHGHLQAHHLLLTGEGALKLCGFGEPPWLWTSADKPAPDDQTGDLVALGQIMAGWIVGTGRKNTRSKLLPEVLQAVLDRLCRPAEPMTAAALLQELERAAPDVPANTEAWDRLLRHVREHAVHHTGLRASA